MKIISASRRTDIPAFYSDWLLKRLDEGIVQYKNPFSGKLYTVPVSPQDVLAIVFWSKNYVPFLRHMDYLDRHYRFYFHFSITGVPKSLELWTPSYHQAVETFKRLADRYSPHHMIWRFDPIILSNHTPMEYYMEKFEELSRLLEGYTRRCYFSFVQVYYKKVQRQFATLEREGEIRFAEESLEEHKQLLNFMEGLAEKRKITLYACCQDQYVYSNIQEAKCIDKTLLEQLFPDTDFAVKKAPTRKACGCYKSVDIGAYDTCPHGCLYCYANVNHDKSRANFENHDPNGILL